jgi:hypothetical protein
MGLMKSYKLMRNIHMHINLIVIRLNEDRRWRKQRLPTYIQPCREETHAEHLACELALYSPLYR